MRNKVDSGSSIAITPGKPTEAGEPLLFGSFFGILATTARDNDSRVTLHLNGTYDLKFKNDSKFSVGDKVYFNPEKNELSNDSKYIWVGVAVENSTVVDAGEKVSIVRTRLNGVPLNLQAQAATATRTP